MDLNVVYNEDCENGLKRIPDESVDCVLTDPPYLYLKNQKLDVPFDEDLVFSEFKRILKPKGFVVMFGRGTSFYRWNTKLANIGFQFKEEIVWDKSYCTSPLMAMSRVHETISVYTKNNGVINRCKVPYLEMKRHNIDAIVVDIKRLCSVLHNPKSLKEVQDFLEHNTPKYHPENCRRHHVSAKTGFGEENRCAHIVRALNDGFTEKSIIRTDYEVYKGNSYSVVRPGVNRGDRSCNVMQSIEFGTNEKSIIKQPRDHYATIHPTQKPVRLLERLLFLTTKPGDLVVDPFAGSCSTAKACVNTGRRYICFEKDPDYYQSGIKSLNIHCAQKTMF